MATNARAIVCPPGQHRRHLQPSSSLASGGCLPALFHRLFDSQALCPRHKPLAAPLIYIPLPPARACIITYIPHRTHFARSASRGRQRRFAPGQNSPTSSLPGPRRSPLHPLSEQLSLRDTIVHGERASIEASTPPTGKRQSQGGGSITPCLPPGPLLSRGAARFGRLASGAEQDPARGPTSPQTFVSTQADPHGSSHRRAKPRFVAQLALHPNQRAAPRQGCPQGTRRHRVIHPPPKLLKLLNFSFFCTGSSYYNHPPYRLCRATWLSLH